MSSLSSLIVQQLRLPAATTKARECLQGALWRFSSCVCHKIPNITKPSRLWPYLTPLISESVPNFRSHSVTIMWKGHYDTLMSTTFQQIAHIQFLHSLLILWPESFPLEGTWQSDFVWKDKNCSSGPSWALTVTLVQAWSDLISSTEKNCKKNYLLFPQTKWIKVCRENATVPVSPTKDTFMRRFMDQQLNQIHFN